MCSIKFREPGKKSHETSHYCAECSEDKRRMILCASIRTGQNNTKTCFDIWHQDWRSKVPVTSTKGTHLCINSGAHKRKRARRQLHELDEAEAADESSDDFLE